MKSYLVLLCALLLGAGVRAEPLPVLEKLLPAPAVPVNENHPSINLAEYFGVYEAPGPRVTFDTILGDMVVQLYPDATPLTVANFLSYVNDGSYQKTLIHRNNDMGFHIIQGGSLTLNPSNLIDIIPTRAAIPLENGLEHNTGTLAMARSDGLDTATSGWFLNYGDNRSMLDNDRGEGYPYTAFGEVADGASLSILQQLSAIPTFYLGSYYQTFPLYNYTPGTTVTPDHYVVVHDIWAQGTSGIQPQFEIVGVSSPAVQATITNNTTLNLYGVSGPASADITLRVTVGGQSRDFTMPVQTTVSTPASEYFARATYSGDDWYHSETMGWFSAADFPWVYHVEHGWLYAEGPGLHDAQFFYFELGWIFTSDTWYPWMYSYDQEGYMWYGIPEPGTVQAKRWFAMEREAGWVDDGRGLRGPGWFTID